MTAIWLTPETNARPIERACGLRMAHVGKRFGGVVAVEDVSFTAFAGEVHALLGENGAGKSTLMGIASGDVHPDAGSITIGDEQVAGRFTAAEAQRLGFAIVHQHPAVVPDLSVAENLLLAVPRDLRLGQNGATDWVVEQLLGVGCTVSPNSRMVDVGLAQSHLIELAKALAINPKVLVLDEPTAALTADLVDILFEKIRAATARGAAVIYISHRLQEVRQIADRVTVMRDGEVKGSAPVDEMSDEDMLRLIVGRTVTSVFPPKSSMKPEGGAETLDVRNLSGARFHDVSMTAGGGTIVGIAGITGNGQSEFLRALAGLVPASGQVKLGEATLRLGRPESAYALGITFLSSDRQKDGLFMRLSVRENAALSALPKFARLGVLRQQFEYRSVAELCTTLAVRTPSIEANVASLSGGNQQKVVMARAVLSEASVVLAEEPTAGVDVGARAEIYRILRNIADSGVPVVIVSSDLVELEGLCDRVIVFSRGRQVGELTGDEVTEEAMGRKMMTATAHRRAGVREEGPVGRAQTTWGSWFRHFSGGDYAPSLVLAILIIALGTYVTTENSRFLSSFNVQKILLLTSALAFVGYGQICVIFTGGIDVSLGPLIGLVVVISSFFFVDGSDARLMIGGVVAMLATSAAIGLANGSLVRFGKFTAVAATLGVYVIIQGVSVLLRPQPGGSIDTHVISVVQATIGGIPAVFIIAVIVGLGLEAALRFTRWGMSIRAVGSAERSASRIGVRIDLVVVGAYILCSILTGLGGIVVMAQLGIGDANQGTGYTFTSIGAVVLGGASLFGGRGSFIGVVIGALLIQVINSTTTFLGLSGAWQYWFIGGITLGAVALYSQARRTQT
jgi:ribose transport system ATP-binding protein